MDNIIPNSNGKIMLAISTDTLIFMNSKTEIGSILIKGNDKMVLRIEGDAEPMTKIIHGCFQAREENSPIKFVVDGIEIIFK